MAAVETASLHQDAPPSPTLTNPDMILPYNAIQALPRTPERNSRSPLASSPTLRHSGLSLLSDTPGSSVSTPGEEINAQLGVATAVQMPIRAKPTSIIGPFSGFETTTGYEHGAPLSDIGEEELTPRSKRSRRSRSPSPVKPISIPSTPTGPTASHQRQSSDQLSSDDSDVGDWEDFDSSKMMSGRLAADVAKDDGDDVAESKRNSVVTLSDENKDEMAILNDKAEKILANARKRLTHMEDNLSKARHSVLWSPRSSPNMSEMHQPAGGLYRSISLAGTGRRLKPLNLVMKSSPAHTRGSSDTTPSGLKRLSMIPEIRASSAQEYSRRMDSPQLQSGAVAHARLNGHSPASSRSVNSPMRTLEEDAGEASSPSTVKTSPESNVMHGLGINTLATKTPEDLSIIPEQTSPTSLKRSASAASTNRPTSAASTRSIKNQMSDLQLHIANLKSKASADKERRTSSLSRNTPSPFTNTSNPEQWYTSAPGYKEGGSPLSTNAGQGWSPRHEKQLSLDAQITPVTAKMVDFLENEPPQTAESALRTDARTDVNTPSLHQRAAKVEANEIVNADAFIDESNYEDATQEFEDEDDQVAASEEEQIYLNEVLEESLHDVEPEVPDIPEQYFNADGLETERHEDRLDAFDYENMFLHSAMGNFAGGPGSRGSGSSAESGSVDTERAYQDPSKPGDDFEEDQGGDQGEEIEEDSSQRRELETPVPGQPNQPDEDMLATPKGLTPPRKPWTNERSESALSVSTVQSFATAAEDNDHGDNSEIEDEIPYDILNWGTDQPPATSHGHVIAGSFPSPETTTTSPTEGVQSSPRSPTSPRSGLALHVVTGNAFTMNGIPTPPITQSSMKSVEAQSEAPASTDLCTTPQASPTPQAAGFQQQNLPDHPANTEILMESLIKLADPDFRVPPPSLLPPDTTEPRSAPENSPRSATPTRSSVFADVDKDLVLALLRAVGGVCNGVLVAEKQREVRDVKVLRRRLDLARQVLEGNSEGLSEE